MWEGVGDRTELQHIDPHSYGHQYFFPVLLGCSTGGLGPSLSGCWFSRPHLISNSFDLQTNWLPVFTEVYNSSTSTFFLWVSQIVRIQPIHGQGYTLLFLDRMHLLFTYVHFLFWQPGQIVGQYTTLIEEHLWYSLIGIIFEMRLLNLRINLYLLRTFILILVVFVLFLLSLRFGQISPLAFFRWFIATSDRNAESCNRIPSYYPTMEDQIRRTNNWIYKTKKIHPWSPFGARGAADRGVESLRFPWALLEDISFKSYSSWPEVY